jgi:hypothetical protein
LERETFSVKNISSKVDSQAMEKESSDKLIGQLLKAILKKKIHRISFYRPIYIQQYSSLMEEIPTPISHFSKEIYSYVITFSHAFHELIHSYKDHKSSRVSTQ